MNQRHASLRRVGSGISSFILAAALFLSTPPAPGQDSSGAAPLLSVQATGSTRFKSEQIAASTGLQPGKSITRDDIQAGADRLAKLGPFASVQYRYSTLSIGIKIEYQVSDAPEIPASFDNFPWFTDEELTAGIRASVPLFDGMAPAQGVILDQMCIAIEKLLDAKGMHVRVNHALTVSGVGDQQVQLFSAEGDQLNVGAVLFSDELASGDRMIGDRVTDLLGKPFSRASIEIFELEQVRPVYLAHGFLRVKFGPPTPRLEGDPKSAASSKLVLQAPVEPGAAYTWGGVTWKGDYSIPSEGLDEFVKLRTGDVADGMKIEGAWQGVRDLYSRRGYLDAKVEATPVFDDAQKRVAYQVSIDEGPQYHMGSLMLTGLSIDGEKKIRSAWTIAPNAVFDKRVYEEFVDIGIRRAFAGSPFHYDKIGRFLQEDPKTSRVDVLLDFQ